jgi:xanthine dehydrogenase accessory factor
MHEPLDILATVLREVDAGRRAALAVIVATRGSTPQPAGVMVCVDEAARLSGTLGGGCVEAEARRRAHELLSAGQGALLSFRLDHDYGRDDGLICGGDMDVAVEVLSQASDVRVLREAVERLRAGRDATILVRTARAGARCEYRVHLESRPRVVIAGAGHISRELAELVVPLGFAVCVIDDRADFANAERFPPPVEPVVGKIAETLREHPIDENTYVVVVTRGHKHDEDALAAVLDSKAKYIGMIGSRRKITVVFDDLRADGATPEQLERVHAPIGVAINAVTTREIALSIAAELIAVRRADRRAVVEGPLPSPASSA